MDILNAKGYSLKNLEKINIILGKNGCGKSTLLKTVEQYASNSNEYGKVKYITPERGGKLMYDPGIDNTISKNSQWMAEARRTNQFGNFREQSIVQFRSLELLFYREMEGNEALRKDLKYTFDLYFSKINGLLDNIELRRDNSLFKIYKKNSSEEVNPELVSSGEAELISLGIECLVFEKECDSEKTNILFLDSPDVHLHPDLQSRLSKFLCDLVENKKAIIILATHSTAILGSLKDYDDMCVEFVLPNQKTLNFKKISDEYRKILPVFGAHPLSSLFNQTPIFLVEGEDDERIWQQAVRSSNKKLKIYPCSTDGEANMTRYEQDVNQIINSIYDNAKAFSLRDKDEGSADIDDLGLINRFKLSCRAAENMLLSEQVLTSLDVSWDELKQRIDSWVDSSSSHSHHAIMHAFKNMDYDRKNFDLKEIRNDLMHIIGKSIAWEVAVGKTLGRLIAEDKTEDRSEHSIFNYLGEKLSDALKNF